jgi:xylulokinase
MNQDAENIPIGCNKLIYLPYLMGERTPHLDPNCRGVFFGLSAIHSRRDMIRAVMEGVSYSLKDCYSILEEMGVQFKEMLACGGGGRSELWRQMLSDIYSCEVKTTVSEEGAALGAAILAGVGTGVYASVEDACEKVIKTNAPQKPILENTRKYNKVYSIYRDLYGKLKEEYKQLNTLDV